MTYCVPADFREVTLAHWAVNLTITESDCPDVLLTPAIAHAAQQIEYELNDDFDPPSPDNDETIEVDGQDDGRLYLPRRCRSVTTVKTRDTSGTLTTQASTAYRLHSSLNSAGTAIFEQRRVDWLESLPGLTTTVWPRGTQTVQVIGKFGWAAVPDGIKRLVGLRVYAMVKSTSDPLTTVLQRSTSDSILTYGPSREEERLIRTFSRKRALTV